MKYIAILVVVMLVGCDGKEKLSFDSVESGRKQANDNSMFNAQAYRSNHPEYSAYSLDMRGDSTQSAECGQGDGWASIGLYKIQDDQKIVVPLKCSTISASIGCRTDADFKSSPYASQDGKCNADLPFPVPKIKD